MLRRRMLQVMVGIGLVAVSLLGTSTAASASPSTFTVMVVHANGAGSLADEATGGFSWYNRSVALTSVRFYVHAGECGSLKMSGWDSGGNFVTQTNYLGLCGNATTGKWYSLGNVVLDGSAVSGGITMVIIDVYDDTHQGYGFATCARSASSCVVYPA